MLLNYLSIRIYYESYIILIIVYIIKMANKVTTEWFDLQVKHGNYLEMEK